MNQLDEHIAVAAKALKDAGAVMLTAGAGMGVDSGLPDFRGHEGFWKAYPLISRMGISFEEMANPGWFETDPELAWAFYGHRLNLYRKTSPHRGFFQILDLMNDKPGGYFVFTSNVDGQFKKAGFGGERIKECHGSIHHLQCARNCSEVIWSAENTEVNLDEESFRAIPPLPECIHCGGIARPNILMFGDRDWHPHRTAGQSARLARWLNGVSERGRRLVVVEIGAGLAVPTVRMQSENTVHMRGGTLIRINPRDYRVPTGYISIPLGGAEGIRRLFETVKGL